MGGPMKGRVLAPGAASGTALRLDEPLSLWGGLDPASGDIIDPHHPRLGTSLAGRVVVMRAARGSSSSSSVLAEAVRSGHAPAALLLGEPDLILAVGSVVAAELYHRRVPVVVLEPGDLAGIGEGDHVAVTDDGGVRVG
jgi:predicted aconitase with swiveling domain